MLDFGVDIGELLFCACWLAGFVFSFWLARKVFRLFLILLCFTIVISASAKPVHIKRKSGLAQGVGVGEGASPSPIKWINIKGYVGGSPGELNLGPGTNFLALATIESDGVSADDFWFLPMAGQFDLERIPVPVGDDLWVMSVNDAPSPYGPYAVETFNTLNLVNQSSSGNGSWLSNGCSVYANVDWVGLASSDGTYVEYVWGYPVGIFEWGFWVGMGFVTLSVVVWVIKRAAWIDHSMYSGGDS